jgi:hypothetical protein
MKAYASSFQSFWADSHHLLLARILILVSAPAAAAGFYAHVRTRVDQVAIFCVLYLTVVLVFPTTQGVRFLMPLLPFYVFYVLKGFEVVGERIRAWRGGMTALPWPGLQAAGTASFVLLSTACYAAYYPPLLGQRADFQSHEFSALCDFLRTQRPDQTVVVFTKPRLLSLMSGQPAARYALTHDVSVMQRNLDELHASLLVKSSDRDGDFENDQMYLQPFIEAAGLPRLFDNGRYAVYSLNSRANQ